MFGTEAPGKTLEEVLYPRLTMTKFFTQPLLSAEWRTVGTGSTTAAYPTDTIIVGRAKPATLSGIKNILVGVNSGGVKSYYGNRKRLYLGIQSR